MGRNANFGSSEVETNLHNKRQRGTSFGCTIFFYFSRRFVEEWSTQAKLLLSHEHLTRGLPLTALFCFCVFFFFHYPFGSLHDWYWIIARCDQHAWKLPETLFWMISRSTRYSSHIPGDSSFEPEKKLNVVRFHWIRFLDPLMHRSLFSPHTSKIKISNAIVLLHE